MNDRYSGYAAIPPDDDEFGELDLELEEIENFEDEADIEGLDDYEFADDFDLDDE